MTLKEADIPFALGGSYACWARGGPEPVHDVDFMLREEDVPQAVAVLAAAGLRPVDPPEDWLTKVFDGEVLVDLIHHPVGRAVTTQMLERSSEMSVDSVRMPVLEATDWFEMTLLALEERYCDLARVLPMIRAMREQVDWDQVRRSTAASPFAEAALLVATRLSLIPPADGDAVSGVRRTPTGGNVPVTGRNVPMSPAPAAFPSSAGGAAGEPQVGQRAGPSTDVAGGAGGAGGADDAAGAALAEADPSGPARRGAAACAGRGRVRGDGPRASPGPAIGTAAAGRMPAGGARAPGGASGAGAGPGSGACLDLTEADEYLAGDLHELLAADPRVAELGLEVVLREGCVLVVGEVATDARRQAVTEVVAEALPGRAVRNEVTLIYRGAVDADTEDLDVETIP
ncbi:BON domain-containing protein [Frankia canadensis]|uniref:BON domain-containing protein n=1 Tax=Frankia canadensis TaxID=1836972 RepID=UPI001FAF03CA|nr:BON domain-containing protein [Frankia canadensis]